MEAQGRGIKRTLERLHETSWWTLLGYAYAVFMCASLASLLLPDPFAAALHRAALVVPLLLIVAKDLAGAPDFARRLRQVARPGTAWSARLGALLPPEFLALIKLDRAMWRAFFSWLRRAAPPARPAGTVLTYTKQGAYTTVLAIAIFSVVFELPIDAAIASLFLHDQPTARTVLHLMSAVSALYTLAWVVSDRWLVRAAGGHVLTESTLELSVGIRAFGTIPLAAVDGCERIDEKRDAWCRRHGIALRDTALVTPFDAPNLVLRLRPELPVTLTCYQLEKSAPRYVFLYLDRPEQLANALRHLCPEGHR
jgi:hypothetical protein